jgi:acyl-CoA synthetase (AMP-forming)/AMP-acid ligase II
VLNEQGQSCKPGEVGEIVASGKNIMMGYWNSPEETRSVLKNGKLYTGDLATVDGDGFISIVSRKKDMIKCGANRISPLEIEDVVGKMPGVLECAVVGIPDEILGEAIRLFVVAKEAAQLQENGVMLFCKQNLASYKLPQNVHFVSALPKTGSGKVKREDLRKLTS